MREEAGERGAPGPPPSCSTSHLAVRAGPAVERAGACTCPPLPTLTAPIAEKIIIKYAEGWVQQRRIVFTTQSTRAALSPEKRTPRASRSEPSLIRRGLRNLLGLFFDPGCLTTLHPSAQEAVVLASSSAGEARTSRGSLYFSPSRVRGYWIAERPSNSPGSICIQRCCAYYGGGGSTASPSPFTVYPSLCPHNLCLPHPFVHQRSRGSHLARDHGGRLFVPAVDSPSAW